MPSIMRSSLCSSMHICPQDFQLAKDAKISETEVLLFLGMMTSRFSFDVRGQGISPHVDTHSAFEDGLASLSLGSGESDQA